MSDVVLRVCGLKVAHGGQSAARSARPGRSFRPPLPVPPLAGRERASGVRA